MNGQCLNPIVQVLTIGENKGYKRMANTTRKMGNTQKDTHMQTHTHTSIMTDFRERLETKTIQKKSHL